MTKYPLKLIEWEDSFNGDHTWFSPEDLPKEPKKMTCQTLGFEVLRNSKRVVLAMSVASNGDLCDLFTIPLSVIVREQTFRRRA